MSEFITLYENIKILLEAGQGIVPTNLKVISKSPYSIVMETTSSNGTIVKIELGGAMSPTLSFSTKLIVDYDADGKPVYTDWDHAPSDATVKAASAAAKSKGLTDGNSVDGIIWIMTNAFNESGYTGSGTPSDEVKDAMEQARNVVKGFDYFTFFGNPDDKDEQRNADLTRRTKLYMYVLSRTEVIMKNWVSIYNEKKHMYYFRRGNAIHTVLQMYADMDFMFNSEAKVINALEQLISQSEPVTDSAIALAKEIDNEQITKWIDQNSRNADAAKNG